MIRVLVKASSSFAKASIESLLQANPALRLVRDVSADGWPTGAASPDVLLVEAPTLADVSARQAMDWATAGGSVILLVRNPSVEPVSQALRAGVKAVLHSGLPAPEILAAIQAVAAGLVVLDTPSLETFLHGPGAASSDAGGLSETLTPRELEVLRLLAAGLGNKEIASRLGISQHTAKFHVASIMGKLGATSRTQAVSLGIHHGLIMI